MLDKSYFKIAAITDPNRFQEAVAVMEVRHGLPNMDPNTSGPRWVGEDVMLSPYMVKRVFRDYVEQVRGQMLYHSRKVRDSADPSRKDGNTTLKDWAIMNGAFTPELACEKFLDMRLFGSIFNVKSDKTKAYASQHKEAAEAVVDLLKCGSVRGPVYVAPWWSRVGEYEHPVSTPLTHGMVEENDTQGGRTMGGSGPQFPYAKFTGRIKFYPNIGRQTGVTSEDLQLFWEGLVNGFEHCFSVQRGDMRCIKLTVRSYHNDTGAFDPACPEESFEVTTIDNPWLDF